MYSPSCNGNIRSAPHENSPSTSSLVRPASCKAALAASTCSCSAVASGTSPNRDSATPAIATFLRGTGSVSPAYAPACRKCSARNICEEVRMGSLDGKVAVVTGAGRGIGRAEALLLAQEGASVVVNDLGGEWDGTGTDDRPAQQVVDEITAAGGKASANYEDVSTWSGAQSLIDQAVSEFGQLNILVNNAGILRDAMIFNMDEPNW